MSHQRIYLGDPGDGSPYLQVGWHSIPGPGFARDTDPAVSLAVLVQAPASADRFGAQHVTWDVPQDTTVRCGATGGDLILPAGAVITIPAAQAMLVPDPELANTVLGHHAWLNRAHVNDAIRVLRRARGKVYPADE